MEVLAISGSLRKASFNTALLRAAQELSPPGMRIQRATIDELPLYDDDVRVRGWPEPVSELRKAVAAADAVLFVSPEYNYSIPGLLKNAIDWVSRPPDQPFADKPVGIMGASPGSFGTARMQYHLRQVCVFLNAHPLNTPEVLVTHATEKFDQDGRLIHERTREVVRKHLEALAIWTERLRARP